MSIKCLIVSLVYKIIWKKMVIIILFVNDWIFFVERFGEGFFCRWFRVKYYYWFFSVSVVVENF